MRMDIISLVCGIAILPFIKHTALLYQHDPSLCTPRLDLILSIRCLLTKVSNHLNCGAEFLSLVKLYI